MSALSSSARLRAPSAIPAIIHESRYEADDEYSLALLAATCSEQERRLHTLTLLSEYVASGAGGRKWLLVTKEIQALTDLYEAVWCELGCAFDSHVVRSARAALEGKPRYCEVPTTGEKKHSGEQQTLF